MNVASLELCKELYELSGWGHAKGDHTFDKWYIYNEQSDFPNEVRRYTEREWDEWADENGLNIDGEFYPAYDLGYLLRKLTTSEASKELGVSIRYVNQLLGTDLKVWLDKWIAYHPWMKQRDYPVADTPENAACKLAIELFKQGILTNQKGA